MYRYVMYVILTADLTMPIRVIITYILQIIIYNVMKMTCYNVNVLVIRTSTFLVINYTDNETKNDNCATSATHNTV